MKICVEVGELDANFKEFGVFHDGKLVSKHATFDEAMSVGFPDYVRQPDWMNCECWGDR